MFGSTNLDKILAGFTKTIDKLESYILQCNSNIEVTKEVIASEQGKQDGMRNDRTRASKIRTKLKELIDGE